MASPKPSNRNSRTMASPRRSQPFSVANPFSTSSSLILAMSSSSGFGFAQDLIELQDLACRHHADEPSVAVDDRQAVDVGRLHGLDRLAERPVRPSGGEIGTGDRQYGFRLPLTLVDLVEFVHARHANVLVALVDDRHGLL